MPQSPHKSTGLRGILNLSNAYKAFQYVIGDYKMYQRILKMLPPLENKNVLDIGCGNGRLLDFLPLSVNYTGYDFNHDYIQKASKKYKNRSANFFVADINTSPGLPEAYIAFAIGVLHHLNDQSCANFFKSVSDKLKPSGMLVTVDPVFVENQNWIAKRIIKADRGGCVRNVQGYLNLGKEVFKQQEYEVLKNITNIPYDHLVIKCIK